MSQEGVYLLPSKIIQPPKPWQLSEEYLADQRQLFESYLRELQRQESTGVVQATAVIETILTAWTLRSKMYHFNRDPEVSELIVKVSNVKDIAKKYGYSSLWNAKMYGTMSSRLLKLQTKEGANFPVKQHCGRCGRAIWNPVSVKRGVGPVCYHKRGQ